MELNEETKNEIIRECIKRWKQEFDDSIYDESLKAVNQTSLVNVANLKDTIRRFLYVWGRMGRVLGRQEYKNWESRLVEKIEINRKGLEEFRMKDMIFTNLSVHRQAIKRCYESFNEVVGPIAAAKILHLICPNFFPLWDNAIASSLKEEQEDEKYEEFSAEHYYSFMKSVQDFAKRYDGVLSEFADKCDEGKLRILDKFFWWMVHRPLSLFLVF
jgi:hypothetical protein